MRIRALLSWIAGLALAGSFGLAQAQLVAPADEPTVIYTPEYAPPSSETWILFAPPDLGPSDTARVSKPDMSGTTPSHPVYDPSDTNYSN